jgi:predicted acetyltransferase
MRVELMPSTSETAHQILNLYPLYLHDLSEFSGELPNRHGIYEPENSVRTLAEQSSLAYQTVWWQKPNVLFPFLVTTEGTPIGFAMLSTPPFTEPDVDFKIQEFFIVRSCRNKGVGERAAIELFGRFSGRWEAAVLPGNEKARNFWSRTIDNYTGGRFTETIGSSKSGSLPTFRFVNGV